MRLVSINIGLPAEIELGGRTQTTAIFKRSVDGPIAVGPEGLDGDGVGDTRNHGGPDQAVYAYFVDDYRHWSALLDRPLEPGTFGDNLTIDGASSSDLWVGDRLDIGSVEFEVTAPRIPCGTLARRLGRTADFVAEFRGELRPGVYLRVIRTGTITSGASVTLRAGERSVSVPEMLSLWGAEADLETIERILSAPIASRAVDDYRRKRDRMLAEEAP